MGRYVSLFVLGSVFDQTSQTLCRSPGTPTSDYCGPSPHPPLHPLLTLPCTLSSSLGLVQCETVGILPPNPQNKIHCLSVISQNLCPHRMTLTQKFLLRPMTHLLSDSSSSNHVLWCHLVTPSNPIWSPLSRIRSYCYHRHFHYFTFSRNPFGRP